MVQTKLLFLRVYYVHIFDQCRRDMIKICITRSPQNVVKKIC